MWLNVCNMNVLYMNMLSRFLKRHGSNGVSNLYSGWREFDFLWFDQWPLVVLGAADILISTSVTVAWPRTLDTQSIRASSSITILASNVLGRWKHLCWCSLLNQQYLIVGQMCLVCIWFVCETCKDIATLIPAWTVCCASRLGFLCLCPMWLLRVVNLAKEYWQSVQGTTVYIQMKTFVLNYITNDRLHFDMFAKSCTII